MNDFILELQKSIDKNIEKTEEERNRLIELVKSLEIKLNSIEQSATEEQWSFRQKSASLEAEKVSFEREKTFTREKLQAEEKRVQVLNQAKNVCFLTKICVFLPIFDVFDQKLEFSAKSGYF